MTIHQYIIPLFGLIVLLIYGGILQYFLDVIPETAQSKMYPVGPYIQLGAFLSLFLGWAIFAIINGIRRTYYDEVAESFESLDASEPPLMRFFSVVGNILVLLGNISILGLIIFAAIRLITNSRANIK